MYNKEFTLNSDIQCEISDGWLTEGEEIEVAIDWDENHAVFLTKAHLVVLLKEIELAEKTIIGESNGTNN